MEVYMAESYQADAQNPGWVKGWGVYRMEPWHFAGLFSSAEEAEAIRLEKGAAYKASFGSHRQGSDDFIAD